MPVDWRFAIAAIRYGLLRFQSQRSRSDFIKWIAAVQVLQHASWQRYRTGGLVSVERNSDLASDSSGCVCVAQEIGDTTDAIREVFAGLHPVFSLVEKSLIETTQKEEFRGGITF